ncbi:hypothetical protein [Flavobacterium amnicola]|nr:hypothetical protein [Flavobacterium amnicola]
MRLLVLVVASFLIVSCTDKKENATLPKKEGKFEMYQMSEMAMLMEQMYADNERLKQRIIAGDTIGKFPQHFLKIHKAVMTDKQENDNFFKLHANMFITSQELIYSDPNNAKEHFNASIDACVKCHEVKCGGPIVRIKKLYIK